MELRCFIANRWVLGIASLLSCQWPKRRNTNSQQNSTNASMSLSDLPVAWSIARSNGEPFKLRFVPCSRSKFFTSSGSCAQCPRQSVNVSPCRTDANFDGRLSIMGGPLIPLPSTAGPSSRIPHDRGFPPNSLVGFFPSPVQ